ncbi:TetR family transcriptional regulator [Agromyces sp. CFH 90414]|uniref:TetR family transcriptional regulator n=1 Tax=Agromyces agglutinans TaxID=2662258 RepID=A0A6I2FBX4_9MICO|nr:TetR family transcriptional regulator C-terminal domain-containing protein [Agromyces agglutinans]MRG59423.1 TetR family transcriptional regulator [Agromyces agglutinans]
MSSDERMPRTRRARKAPAERAAEITAAAHALALEDGLAAVTLRAVATRAGVTPALVAHYRPAMDALVADTFAAIVSAEVDEVAALVASRPTPTARLGTLVATLLDGERDDVTLVWVEAWALGRRNETLAARVREQMDAWQAVIREIVDDGVAEGAFDTDDAASVAWQVLGMIDGLNAQALVRWGDAGDRGSLIMSALEGMLALPRGALATPAVE